MKKLFMSGTNFSCSTFIFGTASLFNVGSNKKYPCLLESAVDNGFIRFHTALYYGFGLAEKSLSCVLKKKKKKNNSNITMTSKIGIYSLRWEFQSQASFFLRNAIGKTFSRIPKPTIYFGLARAKKSLDASLRWLGREKTELYL